MKNNLKAIGLLMAALVIAGIYSCQNCPDNSKTDGTTVKVGKMSILIPKSYRLVKNDPTGMMFVKGADSTSVNPAGGGEASAMPSISSPATVADSEDTITINPGGKGGTPVTPVTTTSTITTPTNQ